MNPLIKSIIPVVLALFLVLCGLSVRQDYDDSVIQELNYCNMVANGHWPAYNPDIECGEKDD